MPPSSLDAEWVLRLYDALFSFLALFAVAAFLFAALTYVGLLLRECVLPRQGKGTIPHSRTVP